MNPIILQTIARIHLYIIPLFSVFLLLKGHNEPGGGFIAGLMMAAAIVIQAMAFDTAYVERMLPVNDGVLLATGLLLAAGSGLVGVVRGLAFLNHASASIWIPLFGSVTLSTPFVFDVGVYLVVIGAVKMIVMTLAADDGTTVADDSERV